MSGWVLEAFRRQGIEYEYPFLKRDGQPVYVTRSTAYLESAPPFRAGRVRILDDQVTREISATSSSAATGWIMVRAYTTTEPTVSRWPVCMAIQAAVKPSFPPLTLRREEHHR